MKKAIAILFLAYAASASAQVSYRIDEIVGGGYYLVEISPAKDANSQPTELPQRFGEKANLDAYVAELRKKAQEAKVTAARIEDAAAKIEAAGNAFFVATKKKE